ncbi:MAG: tRNA preQ1(34) S-adenosylmethionine ribosyltransferase-isomerase QueA [Anaerolineaceae bacterium]|nr:tRNA preQ1(34) S-adenosylmethionine ribosyltransferase-isomerase QueA [Anaerolineaceae bacterium]
MKTESFYYLLPSSLIAQTPIEPRHDSRMLVYDRAADEITENIFKNIKEYLYPGDVMVINKTKVIPARIFGRKITGGKVEVLLIKKLDDLSWEVLIGGKHVKKGAELLFDNGLSGEITDVLFRGKRIIKFSKQVEPLLKTIGQMPLPPYIHKKLKNQERYQTIYAENEGSAAAPTAGLHFTDELIKELQVYGIIFAEITLHVGLDTFAPVTENEVEEHAIHTEWCQITDSEIDKINKARGEKRRIIAVGTTSVRTLETAYLHRASSGSLKSFSGSTDLYIYPGYQFKIVDAMITNFHLPKSTLLMLVSAFTGLDTIKSCYKYAIQRKFRFYSFGDVMFIK